MPRYRAPARAEISAIASPRFLASGSRAKRGKRLYDAPEPATAVKLKAAARLLRFKRITRNDLSAA
ncbi:hypothetical protein KPB05_09840 [Burkholderia gladioli]|uniref:hypothetical protein n=1 Tax=Burkholderia gladioli TaxID=28095 RepID=UPI00163DFE3A|nr:hypothetical protein [Burkholderia gladioli]MDR8087761.1 hypothetical protein [Burkholderia gladioli]